jgi:hypothetical protein
LPLLLAHQNNMRENTYITKKGVNMEQGWHLITTHKELPSLAYSTTIIQVVSKRSYKK